MKKLLKLAAALAAIFVVLLAAAAVAVRVYLPPEKLKALAISQADKSLHRTLELRSVDFGVFTGLSIEGLRLSEAPDFSKGEFLTAETFTLRPEWLPLLRKEFVARRIELRGASVAVVKLSDGRFNFSDLMSAPVERKAGAQPAPPAAPSALALAVDSLRLSDVALHYADQKDGSQANLVIGAVDVDDFSPSGPFSLSTDLKADYAAPGERYSGSLKANGKADLGGGDLSHASADLASFVLTTQGEEFAGSLRVEGAAEPAGIMGLKLLELRLGGMDVKASGTVSGLGAKAQTLDLKLDAEKFQLSSLAESVKSMKPYGLSGTAALSAVVRGSSASPRASGTLTLDGVGAKYQGQSLEKTSGRLLFTQDSVNVPELTGRLNGGDFKLTVAAAHPAAPVVTISGWLSLLDLGALQKLAGGPAPASPPSTSRSSSRSSAVSSRKTAAAGTALKTSGDITVDKTTHPNFECGKMTLNWNLTGITPDMTRLAGTAKLMVGAGKATNILDLAAARGGLVRAMLVPVLALQKARDLRIPVLNNIPDLQNMPFNRIEGDFTAARGVIAMKPLLADGPAIGMNTTGTVDMGAQTANLKTAVKTSLGEIDLAITGPLSNVSVRPNVSQQLQSTGKKLLQEQGKALLNKLFHP